MLESIPSVLPKPFDLPQPLAGLERLAANLWWTWNPSAQDLFRRLDPDLWAEGVPPAGILRRTKNPATAACDTAFVADVERVAADFDRYMAGGPRVEDDRVIAYFCAEYGFHESMNIYAGGLGILAGDHCKEASDMNLPFVGIGMFYRRGFFHQMVDWEGRQEHLYPELPPEQHSVTRVVKPGTQEPLTVQIPLPGRTLHIAVWLASVGRIPLLLMDTDLPENAEQDRPITSQLYVNTREMRLHQETVLGVGGVRVLRALGIAPTVWHMNEGHSAFLLLERLREQLADGATVDAARLAIQVDSVITIHTPVPEGNERFSAELADSLIAPVLDGTSLTASAVLGMGLGADGDPGVFDMTAFALRNARMANGVSLLHGHTADKTWRDIAGFPVIGVTNGVHMPTWIGPEMKKVFAAQGAEFDQDTRVELTAGENRPTWERVANVPDRDLWQAHLAQKKAMIAFAKRRLYVQHARHGEGPEDLRYLLDSLNPDAMIIGFARRFATYKRASLLFTDEDRLARMLDAPGRPIQLIFSGKSHPTDRGGQELIKKVYQKTQEPRFRGKVFLLEDYDIEVGRNLVQGADIWLNNPRRPLEASGTSGMKAAANGLPNVSILDGWWDEAFEGGPNFNGWAIGGREEVRNWDEQDRLDAEEAYRILETEVIPLYFDRDAAGLPIRWIPVMKRAIATSVYAFSTRRMLDDYLSMML